MKKILRFSLGVFLIVLTAIIWVTSGFLIQLVFHNENYNKPFFLTYCSTSLFSSYLLLIFCVPSWRRSIIALCRNDINNQNLKNTSINITEFDVKESGEQTGEESSVEIPPQKKKKVNLFIERITSTSILIAPLWFGANYTYNVGLNYTSLSSSTIISSGSPMFGFVFSTIFGADKFSFVRLFCIVFTFSGVVLITLVDYLYPSATSSGGSNPLLGNILSIFSSCLYGLYTTILKKRVGEGEREKEFSMTMMFGCLGMTNFLALMVVIPLLSVTMFEVFEIPNWETTLTLLGNGFIGTVFSDLIWACSVILTSSVSALIGLSLSIPLSIVVDLIDGNKKLDGFLKAFLYFSGTVLVCSSFITANISYFFPKKWKYLDEGKFLCEWLKKLFCQKGKKLEEKCEDGEIGSVEMVETDDER